MGSDTPEPSAPAGEDLRRRLAALEREAADLRAQLAQAHRAAEERHEELAGRVGRRTAELEAANRELEAFAYSVSHDLRSPLRAIDGFSRILLDDFAAALPAAAQDHLRTIRNNAQRMGQLIDDLLRLSRLGRQALRWETAAPAAVVGEALELLRAEQDGRAVELVVGELPPCRADRGLLRQVFANLLGNALKYSRTRPVARVAVGGRADADGTSVYWVRDNGVGFDMRHAGKLFGVFQRLHRPSEYEGTGVGLAIVQRIVHRHGGEVWAEAARDRGATFFVRLPGP